MHTDRNAPSGVQTHADGTVVGRFPGEPGTGLVGAGGCAVPVSGWVQLTFPAGARVGRLGTVSGHIVISTPVLLHGWDEFSFAGEAACELTTCAGPLRVVLTLSQLARLQAAVTAHARRTNTGDDVRTRIPPR